MLVGFACLVYCLIVSVLLGCLGLVIGWVIVLFLWVVVGLIWCEWVFVFVVDVMCA